MTLGCDLYGNGAAVPTREIPAGWAVHQTAPTRFIAVCECCLQRYRIMLVRHDVSTMDVVLEDENGGAALIRVLDLWTSYHVHVEC